MKRGVLVFLIGLFFVLGFFIFHNEAVAKDTGAREGRQVRAQRAYASLPLYFIRNHGQLDEEVVFYEQGGGHATFFTRDGVYLELSRAAEAPLSPPGPGHLARRMDTELLKLSFVGAGVDKAPEMVAEGLLKARVNHFNSVDPSAWKTGIPTYGAVVYRDIYDGIDLRFYGSNSQIEYDVVVSPGSDPASVVFAYEGIKGLRVAKNGALEISLGRDKVSQKRPYIYQVVDGERVQVKGSFRVIDNDVNTGFTYGFEVASYDKARALVIDPVLVFSTYLGGGYEDYAKEIALDASGNIYITGGARSVDFPVKHPVQGEGGGDSARDTDAFVVKMNADGTEIIYSTYLGGSLFEYADTIVVDSSGNAYITGTTHSDDFPVKNPIQGERAGSDDIFILKLDETGSRLVYSTYLGGGAGNGENTTNSALDDQGNLYITGRTWSVDFPMVSPIQGRNAGYADAFVTKINAAGTKIIYSTYLGGSEQDEGWSIAVDSSGNAYIAGKTPSLDFPIKKAIQKRYAGGLNDGFLTKINAAGTKIVYSTYLGGSKDDQGWSIVVDDSENAYVTGRTASEDFPTKRPVQGKYGGGLYDGFVMKINSRGRRIVYSTYLGGGGDDGFDGIKLDGSGNIYLSGWTDSVDFPMVDPIQDKYGGGWYDAVLTKIAGDGSVVAFSTYLGGTDMDYANDIALDKAGNVYIIGNTRSADFPVQNPIQDRLAGGMDIFVTKITGLSSGSSEKGGKK